MKQARKLFALLFALAMVLSLTVPAFAEEGSPEPYKDAYPGTITMESATIGESYHIYKLFDVNYEVGADGKTTSTSYIATNAQKVALEGIAGNVFELTRIPEDPDDGNDETDLYQVSIKTHPVGGKDVPYTNPEVIDFINSFIRTLSGGVTACSFPGAVEEKGTANTGIDGNGVATASTVKWNSVPSGYYFVTSSLGSVVTVNTANPNVSITDKNMDNPDWNNEPDDPDPDGPVKDVLNDAKQSIDGDQVQVGQTLTYSITYKNESGEKLETVEITDKAPEGTAFVPDSPDAMRSVIGKTDDNTMFNVGTDNTITWTFKDVAVDEMVEAIFKVTVTEDALKIVDPEMKTVINDADVDVIIGENTYEMKTNKVKNPVKDPDDPVKDVLDEGGTSIDGKQVQVGDTLTYQVSYKNVEGKELEKVVFTDAAPTGTVYVDNSARAYLNGTLVKDGSVKIVGAEDGTITWEFTKVAPGAMLEVRFEVKVTEEALSITNKTVENTAEVQLNNDPAIKTNQVKNPTDDKPDDPNPGKVIVNKDGTQTTTSTGKFGDTVSFDIGLNAVNKVRQDPENEATGIYQVEKYYIYDQLDPGFILKPDTMAVTINGTSYPVTQDADQPGSGVTTYTIGDEHGSTLFTHKTAEGYTLIEATIEWADLGPLGNPAAYYPDCKLHLTYEATIDTDAVIADGGNLNRVRFDYSTVENTDPTEPDPTNPKYPSGSDLNHNMEEKITTTYTYALGLQKISSETGKPLKDAQFKVTDAAGNPVYAVRNKDASGVTYYNCCSAGTPDATDIFITDANGQIVIKGVNVGTYSFTETKAPDGYNLLEEPAPVEAQMDSTTEKHNKIEWTEQRYFKAITKEEFDTFKGDFYKKETNGVFTKITKPNAWSATVPCYKLVGSTHNEDAEVGDYVVTFPVNVARLEVENKAGSLLPSTGGMGTTLFYILGGVLVVGAGILLVTKRRMRTEG